MRIAIAADHAGVHLKQLIADHLRTAGHVEGGRHADRVAKIAALELETEEVAHALADGS